MKAIKDGPDFNLLSKVEQWFSGTHDVNMVDTREGIEVNLNKATVPRKGMTALCYAAFFGRLNVVNYLLKRSAGILGCMCMLCTLCCM